MVGVGLEELGVEEFVEGKFFDGELYIDQKKEAYSSLGFKRLGFFAAVGSIFGRKGKELIAEAKLLSIGGNLAGDGYQTGGTLVVDKGGKVLLEFKQDGPADHVENSAVLAALGITGGAAEQPPTATVTCDDNVCTKN